jgi:nucleotide-binding universal stress UspA family protein
MFSRILCAIDGSQHALKAAEVAGQLAQQLSAKLTFLTVTKELRMSEEVKRYMEIEHLTGEPQYVLDEYTAQVMQKAMDAARAAGVSDAKTQVKTGQPARVIVKTAEAGGYEAIVMGARGHGDLEGLLLGSVSHKVSSLAKCTVITVK